MVEEISIRSIEAARTLYQATDLRARLARYHRPDPDSAFWGWNDVWLDPAFRTWSIEDRLPMIACPLLAVQGEVTTNTEPWHRSRNRAAGTACAAPEAPACGHSPHRDQPQLLYGGRGELYARGSIP
jgi:pimeloyl-ACP methyl ester carboxylesterase